MSFISTSNGVLPVAMPVLLPTRKMWVSTAIVGSPKAMLSTTFAVLRPTPGSASSASRVRGTSPACSSTSFFDKATTFFALVRKRPMVFTSSRTRSSPNAAIFCGVSAAANSAGVALLTPASVACAESTTATSRVNGLTCLSSPLGSGMAAWKRRNASAISAGVHCGIAPAAAFLSAATRLRGPLSCASLPRAARRLLCAVRRGTFRATLRATLRGVLRAIVPV